MSLFFFTVYNNLLGKCYEKCRIQPLVVKQAGQEFHLQYSYLKLARKLASNFIHNWNQID